MERKIGFGIIGAGMVSKIHAEAISRLNSSFIAAVFDSSPEHAEKFAQIYKCKAFTSLDDFLSFNEIDAVSICTPSGTHGELAVKAAAAGKHLIIEKPIEISAEKAEAIIEACKKNNVKCSVISQHRFDDAILKLKNDVVSGRLGKLYYGACQTKWYRDEEYYSVPGWRGTWKFDGGGALINQSIHYIDLLLYIMGDVSTVHGRCATLGHDIEVEDIGIASIKFKNGGLGLIQGTTLAYPGISTNLEIYGENGTVFIKDDVIECKNLKGEIREDIEEHLKTGTGAGKADGISFISHMRQYEDIVNAILENREPLVNGEEGKKTLELILSIYESSRQGKELNLDKEEKVKYEI